MFGSMIHSNQCARFINIEKGEELVLTKRSAYRKQRVNTTLIQWTLLLKTTSPKIYKDQLLGAKQIVSVYSKQYGAIESECLSRLINTPRLTATGLRERLLAFQQNPDRSNDSQTQQHTNDQVDQGNSSLAHYAALNGHPGGQGESHVIH